MRNRTFARRLALQFLYQLQIRGPEVLDDLQDFLNEETDKQEVRNFARRLIAGTWENLKDLDDHIARVAHNWRLDRMAYIDLNILRLAAYELLYTEDIPPIVSINEAIELAKHFSTDKSSAFVNGILDKINLELCNKDKSGNTA
ncbi:transcription antitermination factor NusB [Planctomycetota bacterium]